MVLLRVWFGCFSKHIYRFVFLPKRSIWNASIPLELFFSFKCFRMIYPSIECTYISWHSGWCHAGLSIHVKLLKRKIEQNTSAIWFWKVQLLLLDILLGLSLVYSLLKLNFKIHSFFTNIFNLRYNWEKHHKSKSNL